LFPNSDYLKSGQHGICCLFAASQKASRRKGETFVKIPFASPLRKHALTLKTTNPPKGGFENSHIKQKLICC